MNGPLSKREKQVFKMKGTFGIPCFQWVGILCGFWLVMSANSAQAEYLDRLLILDLLRSSQFEELEQKLVRQERLYKQKKIPEEHMAAAYYSFANSDPELEIRLNEWVGKWKLAGFAYLARGIYYCNLGWTTRGCIMVKVPPEDAITPALIRIAGRFRWASSRLSLTLAPLSACGLSI